MRVLKSGDGYQYLLKSVAAGDSDRVLSTPLTRYYAEAGAPPGWWMGRGVADLGPARPGTSSGAAEADGDGGVAGVARGGRHASDQGSHPSEYGGPGDSHGHELGSPSAAGGVVVGDVVPEDQLARLMGAGRDPVTGEPLGRAYPTYKSLDERVQALVEDEVTETMTEEQRSAAVERIEAELGVPKPCAPKPCAPSKIGTFPWRNWWRNTRRWPQRPNTTGGPPSCTPAI